MICKHCGTDHPKPELPCEWPANWTPARTSLFVIDAAFLGFGEAEARVMAVEMEKVNRHTRYEVNERDVLLWIMDARALAVRMAALGASRTRWLGWAALKPLEPRHSFEFYIWQCWVRFFILAIFGLPVMMVTVPIRVVFAFQAWRLRRHFHPLFNGWIEANKKPRS